MEVDGVALHRVEWLPVGAVRGAAVLVHGQGDCAERHVATAAPLVGRGIACCAFDWPGHGQSPGRRGAVPGMAFLSAALDRAAGECGERFGVPVSGWIAHSAGGLVLLHHLAASGAKPEFVWLNAPLLEPAAGRSRVMVALGRAVARLFPNWRISTGVKSSDCRVDGDGREGAGEDGGNEVAEPVGTGETRICPTHHWITLGWADELLRLAETLPEAVGCLPEEMKLLFTQGLDDPVCPPATGRRFFEQLPMRQQRWVGIEGGRHESFADRFAPELGREAGKWLDEEIYPTSPSG